jgi:hypothetical protein
MLALFQMNVQLYLPHDRNTGDQGLTPGQRIGRGRLVPRSCASQHLLQAPSQFLATDGLSRDASSGRNLCFLEHTIRRLQPHVALTNRLPQRNRYASDA